jgi:hypothetical protein
MTPFSDYDDGTLTKRCCRPRFQADGGAERRRAGREAYSTGNQRRTPRYVFHRVVCVLVSRVSTCGVRGEARPDPRVKQVTEGLLFVVNKGCNVLYPRIVHRRMKYGWLDTQDSG